MTDKERFEATAREIGHGNTMCWAEPDNLRAANGHSEQCNELTDDIKEALSAAFEDGRKAGAEQERERCGNIVEAEFARILGTQDKDADPLSFNASVNANIRMMACVLPEIAAQIRSEPGSARHEDKHAL